MINKIQKVFQDYQIFKRENEENNDLQSYFQKLNNTNQNQQNIHTNQFFGHVKIFQNLLNLIKFPLKYSFLYSLYHIVPLNGVLLYGPPGTGKTHIVRSLLQYLPNYNFLNIELSNILSGVIGGSEQRIRDIFQQAKASSPCLLFIDEFQALFASSSSSSNLPSNESDHTSTLLSTLIYCMDELYLWNLYSGIDGGQRVVLIAATNEPWKIPENILFKLNRFNKLIFIQLTKKSIK